MNTALAHKSPKASAVSALDVAALVRAVRLGDRAANDALWAMCNEVAKRFARRWAASAADADDLTQEAMLNAFESFDGLRNPAALSGWMRVIVKRSASRRVRTLRRKGDVTVGENDLDLLPSLDPAPDFQVDLIRLLETLNSLPEEERRCFWLRRCEGLGIDEIVEETALSRATVRRRVDVAKRRLSKRLREPRLKAVATLPAL